MMKRKISIVLELSNLRLLGAFANSYQDGLMCERDSNPHAKGYVSNGGSMRTSAAVIVKVLSSSDVTLACGAFLIT